MHDGLVDLRSDTVTRPTAAMRRAMAEAEVGDDVYREDPTVNRLQERAAEIFGREAALFVPSGSMGNLSCIMAQTTRGQEVICKPPAIFTITRWLRCQPWAASCPGSCLLKTVF